MKSVYIITKRRKDVGLKKEQRNPVVMAVIFEEKMKTKRLLDLLRDFPENVIVLNKDGECIYFDGSRFWLSWGEGANRIHDCWERISEEEAVELLITWTEQNKIEILIKDESKNLY